MNHRRLHDALNLLDDELTAPVASLREGAKKEKRGKFIKYLSIAACICFILAAVTVALNAGMSLAEKAGSSKNEATDKTSVSSGDEMVLAGESKEDNVVTDQEASENKNEATDKTSVSSGDEMVLAGESKEDNVVTDQEASENILNTSDSYPYDNAAMPGASAEVPSLIVTIEAFNDDGFIGTVAETVDTGIYDIGETVNVKVDEKTLVKSMISSDSSIKGSHSFDVGDTALIMFRPLSDELQPATSSEQPMHFIYAELIALPDSNDAEQGGE